MGRIRVNMFSTHPDFEENWKAAFSKKRPKKRKSLDDATVEEWTKASKAAMAREQIKEPK